MPEEAITLPLSRVKRKFGKNTETWKLFEKWFFLTEDSYPLVREGLSKGAAVNLAQGLNRCNIQFADEQSIPDEIIGLSAKAKQGENGTWLVEVSKNYKRAGELAPSKQTRGDGWMKKFLGETLAEEGKMPRLQSREEWEAEQERKHRAQEEELYGKYYQAPQASQPGKVPEQSIPQAKPDTQEDLLSKFYKE